MTMECIIQAGRRAQRVANLKQGWSWSFSGINTDLPITERRRQCWRADSVASCTPPHIHTHQAPSPPQAPASILQGLPKLGVATLPKR